VGRRLKAVRRFAAAHPRLMVALQLAALAVFLGFLAFAVRGSFHDAADDLRNADPRWFTIACIAVAAYYLVFVVGWIWILRDWGIAISYPVSLRAEMVSMLAKYIPGGIWTPAARVVAARRAGITDSALVTVSILVEAGISAVAGIIVFVVSLIWVDGVDAPVLPIVAFGVVVTFLLYPRIFVPLASRVLHKFGHGDLPPLRTSTMAKLLLFYCGTWLIGGVGLWCLLRSVGARPDLQTIPFLGGVSAIGAIVAVLVVFAPSGLGVREGSMYGLLLAIAPKGAALGVIVLNRVVITLVEILLLVVGGLILRRNDDQATARPTASRQPATSPDSSRSGS
jgi:glycosyltransferase 2 family protein